MRRLKVTSIFLVGFFAAVVLFISPAQASRFWWVTVSAIAANLDDALLSGRIFVGSAGNVATGVAMSGDITVSNTGVTEIGATKVTNGMLAGSIAASKFVGTDIATLGTVTAGTWNASVVGAAYGGTGVANNAGETLTFVGDDAVTFTTSAASSVTLPTSGTLATTANVSAASGLIEELNLFIETAADKTYVLVLNSSSAKQVTSVAAKCASGTISGSLKIEGAAITSCDTAQLAWTSSETGDTCDTGSSNNLAAGNTLTLVTSSNSSCLDLQVTVLTTRD